MRRRFRYCPVRQQIKMSWNPVNCFSMAKFKPPNDKNMTIYQQLWKSKALCRLYYNGDVTQKTFLRIYYNNRKNMEDTLSNMERRLENVLFRSMFSHSVFSARKLTSSGNVLVNGQKIVHPGYEVKDGDIVQIAPDSASKVYKVMGQPFIKCWGFLPTYLEVNYSILATTFLRSPRLEEIPSPYPRFMVENMAQFYRYQY